MIPALGQARRNLNVDVKSGSPKKLKTPKKQSRDPESPRRDLKMFHQYDLRTAINHPITRERYIFTGRADWAAGHSGRGLSDSISVCVEAKKATFSFAEQQLMVYLAICHNERKKLAKLSRLCKDLARTGNALFSRCCPQMARSTVAKYKPRLIYPRQVLRSKGHKRRGKRQ
jgi:hypothetical protein